MTIKSILMAFLFTFSLLTQASTTVKTKNLQLVFNTQQIQSLVYQIDCLADLIYCERDLVQKFWNTQNFSEADKKAVDDWAKLESNYQNGGVDIPEISPEAVKDIGFPLRGNSTSYDKKIRIASYLATDLNSYRQNLSLLLLPKDVDAAIQIVERFQKRHVKWWNKTGKTETEQFINKFVTVLKTKKLIPLIEQVSHFYEATTNVKTPVVFHFFYLPGESKHSSGEQVENHSIIEFLHGEKPEQRADVILHELFHYFFRSVPIEKHIELVKSFSKNNDPSSVAAYNLLNEVLATSLGNGIVSEKIESPEKFKTYLTKEKSFYNDAAIDLVAKAMMPILKKALEQKTTLYSPDFTATYLNTVQETLKEKAFAPHLALRTSATIYEKEFKSEYNTFFKDIRMGSSWSTSDFDSRHSRQRLDNSAHLSGLIIIKPESLEFLTSLKGLIDEDSIKKIKEQAKQNSSFTTAIPRTKNSWIFVVIAKTNDQASTQLKKLATAKSISEI